MVDMVTLQPHDPLPPPSEDHVLVVARFAAADPTETVIEMTVNSPALRAGPTPASRAPDGPKTLDKAKEMAASFARERGIPKVYTVDRTRGDVEAEVAEHSGERDVDRDFKDFDT